MAVATKALGRVAVVCMAGILFGCGDSPVATPAGMQPVPPDFSAVNEACGEASCVPVEGMHISHFTGPGCTGTEHYYTPYDGGNGGRRRSWDGKGLAGTQLRTVTNRSWKDQNGCFDAWPGGHTLSGFVRIYRPDPGTCVPFAYVSGPNTLTTPGTYSYEALHDFGSQTGCSAPTSFSYGWSRDGQSLPCSGRSCSFYVTSGNNFSVSVTVGADYSGQVLNGSGSLLVNNWVKCPISVTVSGPTAPAAAGNYTYTMSASAGECGGPIVYGWSLWSYDAQTSTGVCGNSPTCTVAFDPAWPFELIAIGTRYWSDGTNSAGMASLSVVAPFSTSISGPTQVGYGEWGSWSPELTGGRRPYSWEWYVDGARAPDSYSISRSFDPNSSHTIAIVARDAVGNTGQHSITVYTGPGACDPLRGCEGFLRAPAEPNGPSRPRVRKPALQPPGGAGRP